MDKPVELPLRAQEDVVTVRQAVRTQAVALGLSLVDQTKLVTAASELARNTDQMTREQIARRTLIVKK